MITLAHLVEEVLFENLPAAEIVQLLPVDLSKNLKSLIAAIVTKNIPKWRETATSTQISLPRLVSTDWRVDVKTASESMSRFNQAGLIVEMQVVLLSRYFLKKVMHIGSIYTNTIGCHARTTPHRIRAQQGDARDHARRPRQDPRPARLYHNIAVRSTEKNSQTFYPPQCFFI